MTARADKIEAVARRIWEEDDAEYWGDDPSRNPFDPDALDENGEPTAAEWLKTVTRVIEAWESA